MQDRKDALIAASDFVQQVKQLPREISSSAVATVGRLNVFPNGVNVIPGKIELLVDVRDIKTKHLNELVNLVIDTGRNVAKKHEIKCSIIESTRSTGIKIKKDMQNKIEKSMNSLGIEPTFLSSGASHDSLIIGKYIPVGMIFI